MLIVLEGQHVTKPVFFGLRGGSTSYRSYDRNRHQICSFCAHYTCQELPQLLHQPHIRGCYLTCDEILLTLRLLAFTTDVAPLEPVVGFTDCSDYLDKIGARERRSGPEVFANQ